jgi:hypothetical protein
MPGTTAAPQNPSLPAEVTTPPAGGNSPRWHWATRVAFRFSFVYLVLYILPFPFDRIPYAYALSSWYPSRWTPIVTWVGRHVFRVTYELTPPNGSGDTTWNYLQVFCFLVLAGAATLLWSVADRRRRAYPQLYGWLRILVRLFLAMNLLGYGFDKLFPLQMPPLSLSRMMQTYGDSSPFGLLWTFMGASPAYEIFCGATEIFAGVLLVVPRTAVLGALSAIAILANVFALNLCYDVPVKLFSFHLLLAGVFLVAPEAGRLARLFLLGGKVELSRPPTLFSRPWLNRSWLWLQLLFGIYLASTDFLGSLRAAMNSTNLFAPHPPLYGIWMVEEFSLDGKVRPPLLTDETRWSRVIFESTRWARIVEGDGRGDMYTFHVDFKKETLLVDGPNAEEDHFTIAWTGPGQMTLKGPWEGHQVEAKLRRYNEQQFRLTTRGFHWINEEPYGW